jgi:hypothetical protein
MGLHNADSANNGPYGDALLKELIPYLEGHFRMIKATYARVPTAVPPAVGSHSLYKCCIPISSVVHGRSIRTRSISGATS